MLKFKKIKRLYKQFLQTNFHKWYWTNVFFKDKTRFIVFPNSIISISQQSSFIIKGSLSINASWFKDNFRRYISEFRLDDHSTLVCLGDFKLYQGASIYVAPNAKLILMGNSFINTNSTINCFLNIEIGDDCGISDNVTITDSDNHTIVGRENTSPVIIKDHVWIGKNSTILKGVTIGKGAVVAAGSVVVNDVPEYCLVAGVPAKVIKENVDWKW
ncbi:MAG: acetyltransferase-like isoleucine patch superfamily enzyme [Psychroserpens sp.]